MDDRQLIEDLLSALEYHTEQTRPIEFSKVAIQAAREYLRNPPQRKWVGMTEDEAIELLPVGDWEIESTLDFAQAIESALREKNK